MFRYTFLILSFMCYGIILKAGTVEKTFYFNQYKIESRGPWQTLKFENTILSGITGEPALPWHDIVLMLPPGESAASIELVEEQETLIPGSFMLYPQQPVRPTNEGGKGEFTRNEKIYSQDKPYPDLGTGHLMTQYLDGYAFALCTFTPVRYNPVKKALSYFRKVTVRINTTTDTQSLAAMNNLPVAEKIRDRVRTFAMNPGMIDLYPQREAPAVTYDYLIISPEIFKNEFPSFISMYAGRGISVKVVTLDSIWATMTGYDLQEKMRNFVISEHQNHNIQYLLLAGSISKVPHRGFYCYVNSGGTPYTDANIPADIYFSGLDGTYDANGNYIYAELADNPDLLPEISVARFTASDTAELHHMIHKSICYQTNPVLGEFSRPLLAGEYLYDNPMTFGSDYMNLLINNRNDNGYYTHGIPSASNNIQKLYDTLITASPLNYWSWSQSTLLAKINQGNSFIHHLGHANSTYMMRLYMSSITNANFSAVNGITHNYQLLYTQGCDDGAIDYYGGCIAAKCVSISNFLVAGIFNSRYGWFNQGTTDGPSQHLEREFVSALYNDTLPEKHLGTAHLISKIKTAPWISLPGEFEPGAQRWVQYDCNVLGDPALTIWTEEPASFGNITWTGSIDSDWNKPGNWNLAIVPTTLYDVTIPDTPHDPVITTINNTFCHNITIQNGGNLTILPGKSMVVYGTVTMSGE